MMKRNVLLLLLSLSVLFNLFFAVGYLRAKAEAELAIDREHKVTDRVVQELNLDQAQADVFTDLRTAMAEDELVFRQSDALAQQELVEELRDSEPDLEHLRSLVARRAEVQRQRQVVAAERLGEFFNVLSSDQQRRLLRRLRDEPRDRERMQRLLERFDEDRDGELSDEERSAARAFLEERRRECEQRRLEHRQRREEMRKRFDADQDGRLDDGERAAMRQWWEESGRGWNRERRGDRDDDGRRPRDRPRHRGNWKSDGGSPDVAPPDGGLEADRDEGGSSL